MLNAKPNDIINELEAVLTFIREHYGDARYERQNVPTQPQENTFVIRFQNTQKVPETALSYVDQREWQIIYFGGKQPFDVAQVLERMNGVDKLTAGAFRQVIPIENEDSLRYMRVTGFSFGQPFLTEDDRHASIGVLTTEIRRARDVETYQKILRAGVRTN